ncbi:MAG: DUF2779 domain-containing protein [Rhodocyclaceae bacterium]|nr:DUF2779 domain-containing protein [Rhodocyclaceae bacterium]
MTLLTKSDLLSIRQCKRKLWLDYHQPLTENGRRDRRAVDGELVNAAARAQLGDVYWPSGGEDKIAAAQMAFVGLAANPDKPAVEMPLVFDGVYVRIDALLPSPKGYLVVETKASSFPLKKDKLTPGTPDAHHIDDIAIQTWALHGTGIAYGGSFLNLLDGQWRYPGAGDYSGLFRRYDVTDIVASVASSEVPRWVEEAKKTISAGMPDVKTGTQCEKPHPCPHKAFCATLEEPPNPNTVMVLPGNGGKALARKLLGMGFEDLTVVPPERISGSDTQLFLRIQEAHKTGKPVFDEVGAKAEMGTFPYPRSCFDFEAIDLAIPKWKGVRPYEQITFQWSCHVERSPGVFEHFEFLDLSGDDPSIACIESLLAVFERFDGPIFVYYLTYEESRLRELALRHPEYADRLEAVISRLVDLLPITKRYFYSADMLGSFSIKSVLPCVSSISYEDLDEVADGTAAQVAYMNAALDPRCSAARKSELRGKLLTYCKQDTLAMVLVAHFLEGKTAGTSISL